MKYFITIVVFLVCLVEGNSQSFWFGPRGGPTLGIQRWNTYERQPLFAGHVGFFIESLDEDRSTGSLYASLGLHQRGSSVRSRFTFQNQNISGIKYVFNNISLQVGAKKFFKGDFFYLLGLRGEYTAWTNLQELNDRYESVFFPQDDYVRPITAGATIGGGWQYEIGELYGLSIDFTINPDFFNQYRSPRIDNVVSPFNGQPVTLQASEISNTTVELTFALRFLRKVEYID